MSLHVEVTQPLGRITLEVAFDAPAGLTALIGPSGAGKTSVLNAIAGFLRPSGGRITCDGDVFFDAAAGVNRSPHERRVGYMFQEPRLFPHMNVRHNLTYGQRFARGTPAVAERDVIDWLGLGALLTRSPQKLSGGEKQRVALGRALLSGPRLLLLDEPLASVDRARRDDILPYLDRLRAELRLPAIYVTHNVDEIMQRADRTIVLDEGRIVSIQDGRT